MKTYKQTKGSHFVEKNALFGNSRSASIHILKCQTALAFIFCIMDLRLFRTVPFIVDDVFLGWENDISLLPLEKESIFNFTKFVI